MVTAMTTPTEHTITDEPGSGPGDAECITCSTLGTALDSWLRSRDTLAAAQRRVPARPPTPQVQVELPLVECMPWCDEGDGHPNCWALSDQSCWEISQHVDLSLEEPAEGDIPQRVGVLARRRPHQPGHVLMHLDGIRIHGPIPEPYDVLDHTLMLTPDEAERLGRRLIASAELARLAHPPGG